MKTLLHFAHTEAPQDLREQIEKWVNEYMGDYAFEKNMKMDLFCTKESPRRKTDMHKFKCVVSAKAPWMTKAITVKSFGESCWQTITDSCHRARQLIHKERRMRSSRRHFVATPIRISSDF